MAWILLEGLDRSGKSSVAEMYKKQGYEIVHMNAPDKKFFQPGYSGESYLEEIVDIYSIYNGKDVLFDRTIYGELVWPEIYNRMPLLNAEDFEYLQKLEYNNNVVRYLLHDKNVDAHWQRCVENKEPLNRLQFVQAGRMYDKLAQQYNFEKRELGDFAFNEPINKPKDSRKALASDSPIGDARQATTTPTVPKFRDSISKPSLEERLERANAIRGLLQSPLVKKKGEIYESLEKDIKDFLEKELQEIFSEPKNNDFTQEEIQILKLTAQRMKDKLG